MARIRTIKPEFWKNEDLSSLPPETHMLAVALLNYADDEGYFNANPKLVKADCAALREDPTPMDEMLDQLAGVGYIRLGAGSNGRRYGHVVNFAEHQYIQKKKDSEIRPVGIEWDTERPATEPLRYSDSTTIIPLPPGKEGKGKEQGKEGNSMGGQTPAPPDEFEEKFQQLRELYPKRSGDQRWPTARKHIRARLKEGHTWDEIFDGVRRYATWVKHTGKERTETVKQAATFVGTDKAFLEEFPLPAPIQPTRKPSYAELLSAEMKAKGMM